MDAGADTKVAPFCASLVPQPKFCADFDVGMITDYGQLIGTPSLDSAEAKSPPRSLVAEVATDAGARSCALDHPFADAPSSYQAAFDVFVDAYDATHDVELVTVYLVQDANHSCLTVVSIRGGLWAFDESCVANGAQVFGNDHVSTKSGGAGSWYHVEYSVSFAARVFSLKVDSDVLFASVPIQAGLSAGTAQLLMGISFLQPAAISPAKVHVDNVRFDDQ